MTRIGKWITDNNYRIIGPCREAYLRANQNGDLHPARFYLLFIIALIV